MTHECGERCENGVEVARYEVLTKLVIRLYLAPSGQSLSSRIFYFFSTASLSRKASQPSLSVRDSHTQNLTDCERSSPTATHPFWFDFSSRPSAHNLD